MRIWPPPGSSLLRNLGEIVEDVTNSTDIRAAVVEIQDRTGFLRRIQKIMAESDTHIVCFDADKLTGINHVRSAVDHAVRSFKEGNPISNTIEMEALLYASGSRQTSIGASFGIHEGKNHIYICCFPLREGVMDALGVLVRFCEECDPWKTIDNQKREELMRLFEIAEEELATTVDSDLEGLVLERVALLDVAR
jgi:KEOPS complex subunit Cgi121